MSRLINLGPAAPEPFLELADDQPLPSTAQPLLLTPERWERDPALQQWNGTLGLRLPNSCDVMALPASLIARVQLIALEFPTFADGRAYSQACLLRQARSYTGQLRASGDAVVRDQIASMARCGFDSFDLRADQDSEACLTAIQDQRPVYQPANDSARVVRRLRRQAEPATAQGR